ncbi:pre-peptidase C-terminal domain-containing protein [Aliikangiella sp. G2MR2-5]|uniref:pre-peptidase C-terminal domain-containing protein n=1 Tax=Aliikangiella sp. G2MR2-5 TaxID=2788943 RepID=UPI0018AA6E6D|nr:pre-peptidase C-terminal domain-containing protein [Aliikangiella sp. G2MR2-5]
MKSILKVSGTLTALVFASSQLIASPQNSEIEKLSVQLNSNSLFKTQKQSASQVAKKVNVEALLIDQISMKRANTQDFQLVKSHKIVISKPEASFIKVHFNNIQLPSGAVIEVKDPQGTMIHRYGEGENSLFTLMEGDDGERSFSALSIFGDTAIVEVIFTDGISRSYRVEIDSIMQGFSELEFDEALNSSPMLDIEPQSTCGVNERRDVQCWADSNPTEFERTRPVAKILINGSAVCSAWRVGESNRMFTNNHCISSASGVTKTEIWFNYQKSGCGSGSTSGTVIVTGDQLLATSSDLDYTLFTVKRFEDIQEFGHYGLDVRNPVEQERIYIPQHGRGQPKQLSIESDKNSDGLCRVDVTLADGSAPNTDMGYMCDTIGGSSGSPVLAASSNNVLALHHFGGCPNQGVLINRIWPEVATHFDNQIPVGDNGTPSGEPVASFNFESSGLEVTFSDTSSDSDGTIESHLWDFGDGQTSNDKNPVHSYSVANDYSVSLLVTDNDGNSASNTQVVSVTNDIDGELSKGVPVANLFAPRDDELEFFFDVPEDVNSLSFDISGGSGDADLYVSLGEKPTSQEYDCRPYKSGNIENCRFSNPQAGRYYVMLKAYSAFSGVSLEADYFEAVDGVSFEESDLSDSRGNWKHFTFEIPKGMSQLNVSMSGGSGDADLYLRYGSQPTTSSYDCRPYKNGNSENCTVSNPQAGIWHISIRAYSNYSGVTLIGEAH